MTTNDDLRAVATELLRLYDWRFELAHREKLQIDMETNDPRAIEYRSDTKRMLAEYGRQKKAAWDSLRALLARPVEPSQDVRREQRDDQTLLSIIAERFEHERDEITRRDARWVVHLATWALEHGYGDQLMIANTERA